MKIREIVLAQLKPYFKEHGYKFQSGYAPAFIKKAGQLVYRSQFSFGTKYSTAAGGIIEIAHLPVEELILEIGMPGANLTDYKQGKDQHFTVRERIPMTLPQSSFYYIDSESDAVNFAKAVIVYLEERGWAFAHRFNQLENVLTQINQLMQEGRYWSEILDGGPEHLFKGLIIARLYNDKDFGSKIRYVDSILFDESKNLSDWIPYYELLKQKLAITESMF